jgi:hypothetical protein
MMNWSLPSGLNQKTENLFKIPISDFVNCSRNKENFTEKHFITSIDSTCRMEITIIPSYNQLTTEILEKIVSHEDSKITVDTLSRL